MLFNVFLGITGFFYACFALLTVRKPPSGDSQGYGWLMVLLTLGLAVGGLVLAIIALAEGGFAGVHPATGRRVALVLLNGLLVPVTASYCAHFRWHWYPDRANPVFLRWLGLGLAHLSLPLLWLGACFLTTHPGHAAGADLSPETLFWVSFCLSALSVAGLFAGHGWRTLRRTRAKWAEAAANRKRSNQEKLARIAVHQPGDGLLRLFGYASPGYQPEDVWQAALAKIKAQPDWEDELLNLLQSEEVYRYPSHFKEVYTFLETNRVDHPVRFLAPLRQNIERVARYIQEDINTSNSLPKWSYDMYGIPALLGALDNQFAGHGMDFVPAVEKLLQALQTPPPERFKGVRFNVTRYVARWLKAHKK
ncbi:MAG TPA: hypothetical protein VF646_14410 [Cytophagales bacterium]|jgi:hypothetical protein